MTRQIDSSVSRWSLPIRLLHWLTALLLALQLVVAWFLMGDGAGALQWISFHISLGVVLGAVIGVRLLCRVFDRGPARRASLARLLQATIYVQALAVSATGWLAYRPSPFAGRAVVLGYFDLPTLSFMRTAPWAFWHKWLVWLFVGMVVGHIAVAIYHARKPGDSTLAAMSFKRSPGRKRRG